MYISACTVNEEVMVWKRDAVGKPRQLEIEKAPRMFYVSDDNGDRETIYGNKVRKIVAADKTEQRELVQQYKNKKVKVWESDIAPEFRVLSKKYYGQFKGNLNVSFWDIEVDYDPLLGFSSPFNPYAPINAIAVTHRWNKKAVVLAVPPKGQDWTADQLRVKAQEKVAFPEGLDIEIRLFVNEKELLEDFIEEIQDTDVLIGWNSNAFDMPYLYQRVKKVFGQSSPQFKKLSFPGAPAPRDQIVEMVEMKRKTMRIYLGGRVSGDYMEIYKKFEPGERASFKLEAIEQEVGLNLPKLSYKGTLNELYNNDFAYFVRYNVRDCEILDGFEDVLGYVEVANLMYHMSCGLFDHVVGTIKLADLAITNYVWHEMGKVVNDITPPEVDRKIDGALVLLPQVGIQRFVGSIDINALYPNAIRTVGISPETKRGQFKELGNACVEIGNRSDTMLTFVSIYGDEVQAPASAWSDVLKSQQMSVSGYGTVYTQSFEGILSTILGKWAESRAHHSKLADELEGPMSDYHDRLQYTFKIKSNSLYGALSNVRFRFYDLENAESTTATGRMILMHQLRKVHEWHTGEYDITFPMYASAQEAADEGKDPLLAIDGPVFNGKFPSPHIVYGDTDSCYFKTGADNNDDAIRIADEIAVYVNASFKEFVERQFLANDGFNTRVKAVREVVSPCGIFVEKKRYFLHIINMKGKSVDKIKVMGLDTKKTTIPRFIGKKIESFVGDYLKGTDWDDIDERAREYKRELRESNLFDIGIPKTVNKLEFYHADYKHNSKAFMPGHVAAAVYFNQCLEEFGDKSIDPITSGTKVRVFYFKKPIGRFKSIAVPTDLDELPHWFGKEFSVDISAQITRLVDKPLQNIIRVTDLHLPSEKRAFLMKEFM